MGVSESRSIGLRAAEPGVRGAHASDAAATAWLAALPCAAITVAAVVLLGPPLSRLLYPAELVLRILHKDRAELVPEPLEDARYLVTLVAPVLLALATAAVARWPPRLPARALAAGVPLVQLLAVGVVVACFLGQREVRWTRSYFSVATLAVAALIAVTLVLAARSRRARLGFARLTAGARPARIGIPIAAALITAIWVLPAVNSERSLHWFINAHDVFFQLDEVFAVINGLTPLVDFSAQYGSLTPYLLAPFLLAFGKSVLAFTITLNALTVLALLAVYGVLRRAARSPLAAFLLYLPFVATSLFAVITVASVRLTFGTYFPMLPLRYGGPYVLAWLLARHLDRERPAASWPLLIAAGLVLLNNTEFGVPAFGATVAALLVTMLASRARDLWRLLASALLGLAGAFALVSALTLARAGSLPDIGRGLEFARLYAGAGYSVAKLPGLVGLPSVIYLTYLTAIVLATVRAVDRAPNRVLTGMLAWSGVFGLGSASYYVARSNYEMLPSMFSAWALALALLAIAALHQLASRPAPRNAIATLAVLFGLGLTVCSLAQVPAPWEQIERIERRPAEMPTLAVPSYWTVPRGPAARRFVSSVADGPRRFVVKPGAPVALFMTAGHRVADAYGLTDVLPYTGGQSIHTREQADTALKALRDAGGNTLLLPEKEVAAFGRLLLAHGFGVLTRSGVERTLPRARSDLVVVHELTKWVDLRHLHARG